jgi:uncharacterized alkaline shock family protein YloU
VAKQPANKDTKHVVETTPRNEGTVGGTITLSERVVATIAGIAARDIPGIASLGRSRLMPFGNAPRRGVEAEVGELEAALDLEVVIEHGCDIRRVADELRAKVAAEVDKMTGKQVVEVNLDVVGVKLPEAGEPEPELARVR